MEIIIVNNNARPVYLRQELISLYVYPTEHSIKLFKSSEQTPWGFTFIVFGFCQMFHKSKLPSNEPHISVPSRLSISKIFTFNILRL